MKRNNVLRVLCVIGILAVFMTGASLSYSAEKAKGDIPKEVAKSSITMPVLKGDVWQKMTNDEKVSFIWGAGHVINIEVELMQEVPKLKCASFSAKANEAIAGISMQDIVNNLDGYYKANPEKLSVPVFDVIWGTMIKPQLKTGIAGRPLSK